MLRRSQRNNRRRGAALVEFAVCLPVLVLIVLGSVEATSAIFIRQTLVVAAYEAAREAARRDGNSADSRQRAEAVMQKRNVRQATITLTPTDVGPVARGQDIKVNITASMKANSPFFGKILPDRTVTVSTTMVRE
jgi:Flp pilus assembly protein TadG